MNDIGHDPKYTCVKTVLVLKMPDGTFKQFECNALFIEAWGFAGADSQIVIKSMEHHGPDFFIEYDLKSGQALDRIDTYTPAANLPKWAQPYADKYD